MKITNIFKKFNKKKKIRNCFHEDFAHLVEPAFVGAGVHGETQYYKFKGDTELDMTAGRYNKASKFFIEAQMKMNAEDLTYYLNQIEKAVDNGREIKISEVIKWVGIIKDRTKLLLEEKTALKLASATYFDEHEVLDTYDYEYNLKKIKAWQEGGDYSFFFKKPMCDLLPLPKSWQKNSQLMMDHISLINNEIMSRMKPEEDTST